MGRMKFWMAKGLKILLNPPALNHCSLDPTSKVCARSELTGCRVGRYSYIGYQCFMVNTQVGAFCSIADRCSIGGAGHPFQYVSSSPVFHEGKNVLKKHFSFHQMEITPKTIIGNDVWIGQGAFIKAGVTIATGAVIGMGAVVTHDVGPYEIWAGNPAVCIRKRFEDEKVEELMASRWWEMEEAYLKDYAQFFQEPAVFLERVKRYEGK